MLRIRRELVRKQGTCRVSPPVILRILRKMTAPSSEGACGAYLPASVHLLSLPFTARAVNDRPYGVDAGAYLPALVHVLPLSFAAGAFQIRRRSRHLNYSLFTIRYYLNFLPAGTARALNERPYDVDVGASLFASVRYVRGIGTS